MIQVLAMDRLRQHAKAALEEQSYVDARGVLGVPTSPDGFGWEANWDVTAIVELINDAVVLRWQNGHLEVRGRYGARHFRLYRPGDTRSTATAPFEIEAYGPSVWEVTHPDGHVIIRAGIEIADAVYREVAPQGSHLHRAAVLEGAGA